MGNLKNNPNNFNISSKSDISRNIKYLLGYAELTFFVDSAREIIIFNLPNPIKIKTNF